MNHSFPLSFHHFCRGLFPALFLWVFALQSNATPVFEPVQALISGPESPKAKLIQGSDGDFYGTTEAGGSGGYGTVFRMTATGALTILVSFTNANGRSPRAGLLQGSDGNFYGTTDSGGSSGKGTVFKMTPAATLTTLVNFTGANGQSPRAELLQGTDGNFYGTTVSGGSSGNGTVFNMTPTGTLTILVNFTSANGSYPYGLLQGSDGNFYGTTALGGSSGYGTVFKMTATGVLTTLVNFTNVNGRSPYAGLVQGSDGDFYGTTASGGNSESGTVFKMTPTGMLTTLVNFNSTNGGSPNAGLVQGSDGSFYGTTASGGSSVYGTVFKMTATGTLTTLVNFNLANGGRSNAGLVQGSDGNFYGTTVSVDNNNYGTVFKVAPTGTLTTLVNFTPTNGRNPIGGLVQGSDGNFYGTTNSGGSSGKGTVFKMTPVGTLTTLVNFTGANGQGPQARLLQRGDGNFYGTTYGGGSSYFGTVFKMTPTGTLTTLVNFTYANRYPNSGLVQGFDGNFYGTTEFGDGTGSFGGSGGWGTVFKMTPTGTLTTLVSFASYGGSYSAGLVQGSDGDFYGTTLGSGYGMVFKMTPTGTFTTLVYFNNDANGGSPRAGLIQGSDGDFYGKTTSGGSSGNGTVFKMTATGTLTTLASFTDGNSGGHPETGLLQGSDGNFYGTTHAGGSDGFGTVFKMTPAGTLTTLVNFTGANGSNPRSELVRGSDGFLYGMTATGGTLPNGQSAGGGQIYRLRMGPSVIGEAASNITASGATLKGMVNPGGYETALSFQYGTDPSLATYTTVSAGTLPVGTVDVPVQAVVSGLVPETSYYYRVVANNAENTVPQYGAILSFTTPVTQGAYSAWAATYFNPTQLADPFTSGSDADPDKDGIVNLIEAAFNTLPLSAGNPILVSGTGTVGLPLISTLGSVPSTRLRMEFIRRKTGYTYSPEVSDGLDSGGWTAPTGTPTVTSIDTDWERVIIEETAGTGQPTRFGRVRVTSGN